MIFLLLLHINEDPSGAISSAEKEEVDSRSIYVGNVRLPLFNLYMFPVVIFSKNKVCLYLPSIFSFINMCESFSLLMISYLLLCNFLVLCMVGGLCMYPRGSPATLPVLWNSQQGYDSDR